VRTYKLDEYGLELAGKVNHQAIFISTYVEDGSVVSNEVHVASKGRLQVRRFTPAPFGNDLKPGTEGTSALGW
jgi:hypothetical protein